MYFKIFLLNLSEDEQKYARQLWHHVFANACKHDIYGISHLCKKSVSILFNCVL